MRLSDLLSGVIIKAVVGDISSVEVNKIEFDSRNINESDLFIAIKGVTVDGHDYISKSIELGAKSIIAEYVPEEISEGICYIKVDNSSYSMSIIASNYFDNPSSKIKLVGETGTNGKTTVATLLHQLFSNLGYVTGLISTIENKIGSL